VWRGRRVRAGRRERKHHESRVTFVTPTNLIRRGLR